MSYSRSYSETVSTIAYKTVDYDYPASERGGSGSIYVEIEAQIPVDVNIFVDTSSFDRSVQHCENNVDLLTGAVVATEVAEIASIKENSIKVADTIIGGFFSYIRSEISQQIAELTQNIDAQLMHLKELMQSCRSKKNQMEGDFNRISGRYVKIFEDLNNELSNRIYELDKPTFVFKKETDNQKIRTSDNELVNTVAIFGTESGDLQSMISTSIAKKRALDTINKAKMFLWQQRKLNTTIQQSMLNESMTSSIFAPICYLETSSVRNQTDKNIYSADFINVLKDKNRINKLIEQFSSNSISWDKLTSDNQRSIGLYFNTELSNQSSINDQHALRVREMIQQIADFSMINAII